MGYFYNLYKRYNYFQLDREKTQREKRFINLYVITWLLSGFLLVAIPLLYSYNYHSCVANLQNVTCTVVDCGFSHDGSRPRGRDTYSINVTYEYLPFGLTHSIFIISTSINDYCQHIHPVGSTLKCYFDRHNLSTFSHEYTCESYARDRDEYYIKLFVLLIIPIVAFCVLWMIIDVMLPPVRSN